MAFHASALNKGSLVAAICVALVLCWMGEPAQAGSPSSCAIHRCISECPSRCNETVASSCEGAKSSDVYTCKRGCLRACPDMCHSAGGTVCDCDSICDGNCEGSSSGPAYKGCVAAVSQRCEDSCEKDCKGEKVDN